MGINFLSILSINRFNKSSLNRYDLRMNEKELVRMLEGYNVLRTKVNKYLKRNAKLLSQYRIRLSLDLSNKVDEDVLKEKIFKLKNPEAAGAASARASLAGAMKPYMKWQEHHTREREEYWKEREKEQEVGWKQLKQYGSEDAERCEAPEIGRAHV